MIRIKYKPLFDVELRHGFYLSGTCPDLQITPSADCRSLLQNYGLRFLPTESGGKLFAKVDFVSGKDIIKNPVPESTKFTFLLMLKNGLFENFTELSLARQKSQHYYFNNLVNNLAADSSPLLLSDNTSKVVSDADLLTFETNAFTFTDSGTAATRSSELRFTDSSEIFGQELPNNQNVFNFTYDLKKTPSGRAKFFIGSTEKSSMYVANIQDYAGLFGVVEIFYKSSLPVAYQFQQADNSIETKFYKIAFANRSTRWRYVISSKFSQSVTGVTVAKTNGAPIAFTAQSGAPPGQFIIASGNPLPLKEEPITGIKLTDQADKTIIANLPNPPLNLIRKEGTDLFSDILITI